MNNPTNKNKNKVYIVNKSGHNFDAAKEFGKLIPLSEGSMNKLSPNSMYRKFNDILINSNENDYILLSGLSIMNSVACSIFVHKHKKLNLLLYTSNKYVERNLVFE